MERAFPWLRDVPKVTSGSLTKALEKGKGAEYDRIMDAVTTHVEQTRESLKPVIEALKPTLDKLAADKDPEIADFAKQLQDGTFHTPESVDALIKMVKEREGDSDALKQFTTDAEAFHAGEPDERQPGEDEEEAPAAQPTQEAVPGRSEPTAKGSEPERVKPGFVRLYRGEGAGPAALPEWAKTNAGQWFTSSKEKAESFGRERNGRLKYVDIPKSELEAYKAPGGNAGDEYLIPQVAQKNRGAAFTDILPGMAEHVEKQAAGAEAERTKQQIAEKQAEPRSIEGAAGEMETKSPLFRGTAASPQNEMFTGRAEEETKPQVDDPESMQGFGTKLFAGVDPAMVRAAFRRINDWYSSHVADPIIEKFLKTGRTHGEVEKIDPELASKLRLYEAGGVALKAQAEAYTTKVIGKLDRVQERLLVLMADKMSKENLEKNHPEEYAQAISDPEIMKALARYGKLDKQMTAARAALGGQNLEGEHLRWNYPEHVAGIDKKITAEERKGMPTPTLSEVIKPQRADRFGRTTTAEYHYKNGLHEFGPAFSKMYVSVMGKLQEHAVASHFMANATKLEEGDPLPPITSYAGRLYYRPDIAQMIREAKPGAESQQIADDLGVKELPKPKDAPGYAVYDPKAGAAGTGKAVRFIGPEPVVEAMNGLGGLEEGKQGIVAQFIRQQIVGMGFGVPHYMNILRRVGQSTEGGILNPQAYANMARVLFSKELKARAISGAEDPQFAALLRWGGVSPMGIDHYREYIGGNFNPANWAKIGHDLLFKPGGIDQRARLWVMDTIKSQHPEIGNERAAQLVNDAVGRYNRATWTDRMKMVQGYMTFPGWDFSSMNWVIRHPIKTTVPTALLVMLANNAINAFHGNQGDDKWDPFNIHIGRREYGTALLTEPLARRVFKPMIRTAAGLVGGEAPTRAISEGAREIPGAVASGMSMGLPSVTLPIELGTNKKIGGGDIVKQGDWERPGAVLPNKGLEDVAEHVAGAYFPQAGRVASTIADTPEKQDVVGALASNVGVATTREDPLTRLAGHAARANEAVQLIQEGKRTNPDQVRARLEADPDLLFYARERGAIASLIEAKNRLDAAEQRATSPELRKQLDAKRAQVADAAEKFNQRFEEAKQQHRDAATDPRKINKHLTRGAWWSTFQDRRGEHLINKPGHRRILTSVASLSFLFLIALWMAMSVVHGQGTAHYNALVWTLSPTSGVTSQKVYRGTVSGGPYTLLTTINDDVTTSFNDTAVTLGTKHCYVLTASIGTQESVFSTETCATDGGTNVNPQTAPAVIAH